MAKVEIKNMAIVEKRVKGKLKDALQDDKLLSDIGETLIKNIQAKARLGKDPATNQKTEPLKPKTIKSRDLMSRYNPTSQFFTAR